MKEQTRWSYVIRNVYVDLRWFGMLLGGTAHGLKSVIRADGQNALANIPIQGWISVLHDVEPEQPNCLPASDALPSPERGSSDL